MSQISYIISLYSNLKEHRRNLVYLPVYRVKPVSVEDGTCRYIRFIASTEEPLLLKRIEE